MKKKSSNSDNNHPNVNIVDGKLILSLPNAQMPVVWQMDLNSAQSTAFTVKENKKDKNFALIAKSQENEINEIALFDDKQSAVNILMETSDALQNAHGKINQEVIVASNNNGKLSSNNKSKENKIGAALATALIIVIALIWMLSASRSVNLENRDLTSANNISTSPQNTSGVAMSADDFLSNR